MFFSAHIYYGVGNLLLCLSVPLYIKHLFPCHSNKKCLQENKMILETIFWLLCAHAVADYTLQKPNIGRFKQCRDKDSLGLPIWPLYLTAHAPIVAGATALVVGPLFGFIIGVTHWIQDYIKGVVKHPMVIDQIIHIAILLVIAVVVSII